MAEDVDRATCDERRRAADSGPDLLDCAGQRAPARAAGAAAANARSPRAPPRTSASCEAFSPPTAYSAPMAAAFERADVRLAPRRPSTRTTTDGRRRRCREGVRRGDRGAAGRPGCLRSPGQARRPRRDQHDDGHRRRVTASRTRLERRDLGALVVVRDQWRRAARGRQRQERRGVDDA